MTPAEGCDFNAAGSYAVNDALNRETESLGSIPSQSGGRATNRWQEGCFLKLFLSSTATILFVTGPAKAWSSFGDSKLLGVSDPVLNVKFRHLMLIAGVTEITVALVCLVRKRRSLAVGLVAWLATNFAAYCFCLWWSGWHRPCPCLGNLTDALHISPQSADNISRAVLAYLLAGSYGWWLWRLRTSRPGAAPLGGGILS